MDRFGFYKDMYEREIERTSELNERLTLPVSLVSAIGAGIYYLFTQYLSFEFEIKNETIFFYIFLSLSVVCIIWAIFMLIRSYVWKYNYYYLPYVSDLEEYFRELQEFYKDENGITEKDYEEYLIRKLAQATDHNTKLNEVKARNLLQAKRSIVFSLLLIIFALIPFVFTFVKSNQNLDSMKVEIVNKNLPIYFENEIKLNPQKETLKVELIQLSKEQRHDSIATRKTK
ncbi:MAG: hypothetical protein HY960_10865 [Ignavibacteriae bacterium]|nr:hypothetical protein [Ignavibacteriota bacterium]